MQGSSGWRCFYSKAWGRKRPRHRVTPMSQLANNAATETGMSKKPRKSSKSASESSGLQLGRPVEWPRTPEAAKLHRVPTPQKDTNYLLRFTAPKSTSPYPVTGQPDFGHLVIDDGPGQ